MAVYVDELRKSGRSKDWPWSHSCHMMADSLEELHGMADLICLHRDFFQVDHYDLTANKRETAVKNGAVEVSSRMLVALRRRLRATASEGR